MSPPGSRMIMKMAGLGAVDRYLHGYEHKPPGPPVPRKQQKPRRRQRAPDSNYYGQRPHGPPNHYQPRNQHPRRRQILQAEPHGIVPPWIDSNDDFEMRHPMPMPMTRRPRPKLLPPFWGPAPHPYYDPRQHMPPPRRGAGPRYPHPRYDDPYQNEDEDYGYEDEYTNQDDYSDEEIESRHYPTDESDFEQSDDFSRSDGSWERHDPRRVRFEYGVRGQGRRSYGRPYYGDGGADGGGRPYGEYVRRGGVSYGDRNEGPWEYEGGGYPNGRYHAGYGPQDGYSEESY